MDKKTENMQAKYSYFENNDIIPFGRKREPSSFTQIDPGIGNSIKPDVIKFGGTYAVNKNNNSLTTPEKVCTNLLRRSAQNPAFSKNGIEAFFAAPMVVYIAPELLYPPALLYHTSIAQSARWLNTTSSPSSKPCKTLIRRIKYELPDAEQATHNNKYIATLTTMDLLKNYNI